MPAAGSPGRTDTTKATTVRRLTCRYHRSPRYSIPVSKFSDAEQTGEEPYELRAYGNRGEALSACQDVRKSPAGAMVHNVVVSQEAGYNLPLSVTSGDAVGSNVRRCVKVITPAARSELPYRCPRFPQAPLRPVAVSVDGTLGSQNRAESR